MKPSSMQAGTGYEARLESIAASTASCNSIVEKRCQPGGRCAPAWRQPTVGVALGDHLEQRRRCGAQSKTRGSTCGSGRRATPRIDQGAQARRCAGRIPHRAVDAAPGARRDCTTVWSSVQRSARVAVAQRLRVQLPAPDRSGRPTRRSDDTPVEAAALAGVKKNAEKQGQTIIFIDESGLSERPTRVRTWAPRGQTPVLQYSFSWHQLSAIAGVSFWQFYFRLFPGSIKAPQLVEFLRALRRQIEGPLLIIWDGLRAHRSKLVRQYVEADEEGIQLEFLPAYAPELNPVEYIWGYLKNHEIGNLCAHNLHQVSDFARRRLKSMQRRPQLVSAFWAQAQLPL